MNIGFDAKRLFCNFTGLGNYSRTLVNDLANYYPENAYHLYTPEIRNSAVTASFINNPHFQNHAAGTAFKSLWRSYSVVADLKRDGIDLFHGLSNEIPLKINKSGIKSVVTIHDLIFKIYPKTFSLSEQVIYDLKFKYSCQHADKIVAISESTKNDIVHFYEIDPEKIEVIYQACNPLFYTLRTDEENEQVIQQYQLPKDYLLYVGSVEARKNLKIIIESYEHLSPQLQIPIVVIGRGGKYKQEVEAMIAEKDLNHLVIWLDKLDDNQHVQSIYQCARALIYPSFYEGFGLPVAEALLSKTPVITALTSSLTEAGGHHSIYIDPNNAANLADAIEKVLTDTNTVNNMKESGLIYAHQNFTSIVATKKMMDFYKSI
jgi:glycosyltransferase involved in cell wall biosynthesis